MPTVHTAADAIKNANLSHILTPSLLERLAREGLAPCWQSPDRRSFFETAEVKRWLYDSYLTRQGGVRVPRVLQVPVEQVPEDMLDIPDVLRFVSPHLCRLPFCTGVYFLIRNREVVYVGQSMNVPSRSAGHGDKDFDDVLWIPLAEEQLDEVESAFIAKLRPTYNGGVDADGMNTVPKDLQDQDHEKVISSIVMRGSGPTIDDGEEMA